MYKTLLVDDEPLSLEGLIRLVPWERYGMEVAASLNSAYAALAYMEKEHVDVLLTDIRMPIMSGIELISAVREKHSNMKIVLISGYEDFQYARSAIMMNVSAYILKPVDKAELLETMERLKRELDGERAKRPGETHAFPGKDRLIDFVKRDAESVRDGRASGKPDAEMIRVAGDIELLFERLFRATTSYELVELVDTLEKIFNLAAILQGRMSIHSFAMYVISKVDTYLRTMKTDFFQVLGLGFHQIDDLLYFETIEDIEAWLRRKMFAISEHFYWRTQKPHAKLVEDVKRYIKERLADNISLKDAAQHFSFTPNYLGYVFKNESGESFSDYLVRVRLERACELLKNLDLKIYEISERVGYRNMTYFSSNFKAKYGITPIEYRKKSQ